MYQFSSSDPIVRGFVHLEWLKLHLWENVKRADPMIELLVSLTTTLMKKTFGLRMRQIIFRLDGIGA